MSTSYYLLKKPLTKVQVNESSIQLWTDKGYVGELKLDGDDKDAVLYMLIDHDCYPYGDTIRILMEQKVMTDMHTVHGKRWENGKWKK